MTAVPARTFVVLAIVAVGPLCADAVAQSDWDLHMMRLINRARQDPAGEAARIGSMITDGSAPEAPLAYVLEIGDAATNHNNWMHDNLGSISTADRPDSHTHYETLDGESNGTPATGTPNFTGVTSGTRITAAGFNWSAAGENIRARWSTGTLVVDQAQIENSHLNWWESTGHRNNMLSANYTAFGFKAESRTFAPPLGNIDAPFDNLYFATQNFGRPLGSTRTYLLGVLYDDLDTNGGWTPRDVGHPLREGLAGVAVEVRTAGTSNVVASSTTMANGAFSVNVGNGTYDVAFLAPAGTVLVEKIAISGNNVEVGDIEAVPTIVCALDLDGNDDVGFGDVLAVLAAWGSCTDCPEDVDDDDLVGFSDLLAVLSEWGPCSG